MTGAALANVILFERRRRRRPFDLMAKRRHEIEMHARHVGAADTDDLSRWLVAWLWNLPKSSDRIGALMSAAVRMGRRDLTEAEADEAIDEADSTEPCRKADNLAHWLGVTYRQRERLGLTTIGSVNVSKRARRELSKRRRRLAQERRRRAKGARPQSESAEREQPWKAENLSRATWYRRRERARETVSCPPESFYREGTNLSHHKKGVAEHAPVGVPVHARLPRWLPTKRTRDVFSALTAIAAEELRSRAA